MTSDAPRYIVERRDARRWAVIDTQARSAAFRVFNEFSTRRQALRVADDWNARKGYRAKVLDREAR